MFCKAIKASGLLSYCCYDSTLHLLLLWGCNDTCLLPNHTADQLTNLNPTSFWKRFLPACHHSVIPSLPPTFFFLNWFPDVLSVKKEKSDDSVKNFLEKNYEIQWRHKDEMKVFKITDIIQLPSFYVDSLYSNYTVKHQELHWLPLDSGGSFWVKHWLQKLKYLGFSIFKWSKTPQPILI